METTFEPAILHSALFTCESDGPWARARASEIGDLAFVLEQGLPPWECTPATLVLITTTA